MTDVTIHFMDGTSKTVTGVTNKFVWGPDGPFFRVDARANGYNHVEMYPAASVKFIEWTEQA